MANNQSNNKYRLLLKGFLVVYVIELIWFLYSQIIKPLMNGNTLNMGSVELAILLVVALIVVLIFYMLKKSHKVSGIVLSIFGVSLILFGILAPLLDVYIPFLWHLFH
ncbi:MULTISPECIES: hypothetical protein [Vagococcus]|uniref:Uncharacterized protein n=1 Tax=Vagococcus teuberi TaxID=519472 RepID=A0A1J0A5M8_9ENTE|nr:MULTISPECIES: hypothetical protein [Vagococcus]APB31232.1 hypothetical protein BHY08_04950 [Vagococcus teuberi]RHH71206.1 hypothetical protein DW196_01330 [Vagococcus sp. AM17-17]